MFTIVKHRRKAFRVASYYAEVIADSPIAYWRLGEASGTNAVDDIGTYDATYNGSPTLGTTGLLATDSDTAVDFLVNDWAEYSSPIINTSSTWTIEAIVNTTVANAASGRAIYAERAATGDNIIKLDCNQTATDGIFVTLRNDAGTLLQTSGFGIPAINDGVDHHVAVTRNGSSIYLYFDGVEYGPATWSGGSTFTNANRRSRIAGDAGDGNADFTGVVDEVALYDTALSAARLSAHYTAFAPSPVTVSLDSDVLLYVPFTDADASTTADGYVLSSGTHTLTSDVFSRAGNAVINTDQTKMDSSSTSAYGPGANDADGWAMDSTISTGLEVGTASPLSIQFWFYCSNAGNGAWARLLSWGGYNVSGTGFEIETSSTDYDKFIFYEFTGSGNSRRSLGTKQLTANAWNHIYWAFQPSGSSYLGINGTVTATSGSYISNLAPVVDLHLLKSPADASRSSRGYIQEFIVRDTVPYTSNFTPTTVPLVS